MASRNDVTNDLICTKPSRNSAYADNFDRIFRKKGNVCCYCDEEIHPEELVKVRGDNWHKDCYEHASENDEFC